LHTLPAIAPASTWLVMNIVRLRSGSAGPSLSVVCRGTGRAEEHHVGFKVGVQLHPQQGSVDDLRAAWKAADAMGADSIWIWDHFFPLYGDPDAAHYEAYTLLAAMAVDTHQAHFGALVTCNSYRNPQLLADMARTIDLLSHGRFILGIGSGWFERDYTEYGYEFGTAPSRLADLARALPLISDRLGVLNPAPEGDLPILIGGSGEKVTLRLVAEYADAWNTFGPPENFKHKNAVLDEWCTKLGRAPREVERTVAIQPTELDDLDAYVAAGADHFIVMVGAPYDHGPLEALIAARG
jgi:probable F420-dependent oxidoreductase